MHKFEYSFRVKYADTDQMGIMWHGNYYKYMEASRTELLRDIGLVYKELEINDGILLPLTESMCKYRKSAYYDEIIIIITKLTSLKKASLKIEYSFYNKNNELVANGYTLHAFVSKKTNKIVRIPEKINNILTDIME